MQDLIQLALRAARTHLPVLIMGETGTGKELLARFIHMNSPRATKPFVPQNCAAIPLSLFESELFGYYRGAFTSANRDRHGAFDVAHGSTLFLDEVGELPAEAQPKLLRALEGGEIWSLGAETAHRVDVRVIAATSRDLQADTEQGRFRRDLFYRLAVIRLVIPPLRARPHDIALLAEHFIAKFSDLCAIAPPVLSAEALALLEQHTFPGNVRELEILIARAIVMMGDGGMLLPELFPDVNVRPPPRTYCEQVKMFKAKLILDAIERAGSVSGAARLLGMSSRNLNKLRQRLNDREPTPPSPVRGRQDGATFPGKM